MFTYSRFRYLCPVVVVILAVGSLAGVSFSHKITLLLLGVGVALTGIPHGALDPFVANKLWRTAPWFTQLRFLVAYTALAAASVVLWIEFPNAALFVFLVLSAYHFGHDWLKEGRPALSFVYGIALVTAPSIRHSAEVADIYRILGADAAGRIARFSSPIGLAALLVIVPATVIACRRRPLDMVEALSILFASWYLHPLLFFACYFSLMHSPRHLYSTARWLRLNSGGRVARAALPATAATILIGAGTFLLLPHEQFSAGFLQIVFIGLAALTVPHMLLIELQQRTSLLADPA